MRVLLLVLALSAGCASRKPQATAPDYPGELVDPATIPDDFLARQRVRATWIDGEVEFDAVLQKQGDALTMVGLTPFGTRAFTLAQKGREVSFTKEIDRDLPFPPRNILLDVQRALFPAGERAGEEVLERIEGGRLMERSFRRRDGKPAGQIVITYEGGMVGIEPPRVLVLENGWFGYRLRVETESFQRL